MKVRLELKSMYNLKRHRDAVKFKRHSKLLILKSGFNNRAFFIRFSLFSLQSLCNILYINLSLHYRMLRTKLILEN